MTAARLGIAAVVSIAASAAAQTESAPHSPGAIRVAVMDYNGAGLPGAEIVMPHLGVSFGAPGPALLINHVPSGVYVLKVRRFGYVPQSRLVVVRNDTVTVQFALDPFAALLDTVTIKGEMSFELRDLERRLRLHNGRFFTSQDIERSNAVLLTQFLATVPGVHLSSHSSGYSAQAPMAAGANCPSGVQVFLDGVAVNSLEGMDPSRNLKAIAPGAAAAANRPTSPVRPVSSSSGPGAGGITAQALSSIAAGATPDPLRASGALPPFDINTLSLSKVASMEVYPNGGPSELTPGVGSKCAVVLLWSKPN